MRLADGIERLGTETAFEVLARAEQLRAEGRDIINLGIGQPDFATPAHIGEAAIKAIREGHHGYTPAQGIAALREAVCAGPCDTSWRQSCASEYRDHPGWQTDDVLCHAPVRRIGC